MANRVDTSKDGYETPDGETMSNGSPAEPQSEKLIASHRAFLPAGEVRDQAIRGFCTTFDSHDPHNVTQNPVTALQRLRRVSASCSPRLSLTDADPPVLRDGRQP